jgi:hypothetical protein
LAEVPTAGFRPGLSRKVPGITSTVVAVRSWTVVASASGSQQTTLKLAIISKQDFGTGHSQIRIRVTNTGVKPAFLTHFDIQDADCAFYGTDNFF